MKNTKEKITATMIAIMLIVLLALLTGCSPYMYKNNNKINVTHVLAVTEMGDTLKIPIEAIKPNVIYNVMGYNYMRPSYYFRPYNYTYDYYPYNYRPKPNNNVNSNNNSINIPIRPSNSTPNPTISTPPTPAKSKSKRNN